MAIIEDVVEEVGDVAQPLLELGVFGWKNVDDYPTPIATKGGIDESSSLWQKPYYFHLTVCSCWMI